MSNRVNNNTDNTELPKITSKKRKYNDNQWDTLKFTKQEKKLHNDYKKLKINSYNFMENNGWISATSVKNYILNDPLIDWLERYYNQNKLELYDMFMNNTEQRPKPKRRRLCSLNNKNKQINKTMSNIKGNKKNLNLLFKNGNHFEDKVMEYLSELIATKFNEQTVTVFTNDVWNEHKRRGNISLIKEKMDETINYMNQGVPLIFQGVLMNDNNYTYGAADILIRSDFINKIFTNKIDNSDLDIKAPNLNINYHYRVIDVKWTTLTLCANGLNLRNEDRIPAYKAQLAIYNSALGNIQGYTPSETYILSKAWFIDKKNFPERGYSCIDRLGIIDYKKFDKKYIQLTKNAINWVHKVSSIGHTWQFNSDKPDVPELYPNMCNKNDTVWNGVKNKIANHYDEITRVWYLNMNHRNIAHSNNIFKTSDPNCTTYNLGMKNGTRKDIIDAILDTNRSNDLINYDRSKLEGFKDWFEESNLTDYYVDFETLNGTLYTPTDKMNIFNSETSGDVTFMIGIGFDRQYDIKTKKILKEFLKNKDKCGIYSKQNNNWEYVCFYMENKQDINQQDINQQEINVYKYFLHIMKNLARNRMDLGNIYSIQFFH